MKGAIESLGYKVVTTGSGQQAVEMIANKHNHFSVIFMDNEMPRMSGVEAIRKIREAEEQRC